MQLLAALHRLVGDPLRAEWYLTEIVGKLIDARMEYRC